MFERLRNDREINDREITAGYQLARFVTSPAQHSSLHKFGSGKHASLSCLELVTSPAWRSYRFLLLVLEE